MCVFSVVMPFLFGESPVYVVVVSCRLAVWAELAFITLVCEGFSFWFL